MNTIETLRNRRNIRVGIDVGDTLAVRRPKFSQLKTKDVGREISMMPGALFCVSKIVHMVGANNVHIISKCEQRIESKIMAWLEWWGFFSEAGMHRGNVFFCRRRRDKAGIVHRLGITHFIDDRIDCLTGMYHTPFKFFFDPDHKEFGKMIESTVPVVLCETWEQILARFSETLI